MLSATHLRHTYGGRPVLTVERLTLERGSITALAGPNGSGKSTLLRVLAFLERPASGTITLDGVAVRSSGAYRRARRRVTLVEQVPYLFSASVLDNVVYGLRLRGLARPDAQARAGQALERVQSAGLARRHAWELSEGERQRVALARALALDPDVLLLDEPAGAVDRAAAAQLHRILREERARGAAVCFASHHLEDAYRWSDGILGLTDGHLGAVTPENLFRATLPEGSGSKVADVGPIRVVVVTDRSGPVTLAIPPHDVLVSHASLHSSARNEFVGPVVRISDHDGDMVTLTVDAGVDLAARITRSAMRELDIHVGTRVVLTVKALAVQVF
jgi:tungstate transport system ATP-binding protein